MLFHPRWQVQRSGRKASRRRQTFGMEMLEERRLLTRYLFTPIDVPDSPSAQYTTCFGINNTGQIVGNYYDDSHYHSF